MFVGHYQIGFIVKRVDLLLAIKYNYKHSRLQIRLFALMGYKIIQEAWLFIKLKC